MSIYLEFLDLLEVAISRAGNAKRLAEAINVHPNLITRWRKKERIPGLDSVQPVFDYLGVVWTPLINEARLGLKTTQDVVQAKSLEEENANLRMQLDALRLEHAKSLGQVELLKEQLANAQRTAISNCVTQTVNGDKNRAVINAENKEG